MFNKTLLTLFLFAIVSFLSCGFFDTGGRRTPNNSNDNRLPSTILCSGNEWSPSGDGTDCIACPYGAVAVTNDITCDCSANTSTPVFDSTSNTCIAGNPVVATPTFSPVQGTYSSSQSVTINDATSGAIIHYTTDGVTTPICSSTQYLSPIVVSSSETIMAVACRSGWTNSAIGMATYNIGGAQPTPPVFTPAGSTYTSAQNVTISENSGMATISYTTTGATPTCPGTNVINSASGIVSITSTTTLKAVACSELYGTSSTITNETYTINYATCGGLGASCCPGSTCNDTTPQLACKNNMCVACGNLAQTCCGTNTGERATGCDNGDDSTTCFCGAANTCLKKYVVGKSCTYSFECLGGLCSGGSCSGGGGGV